MQYPTLRYEEELWNKGYQLVAGVDEVGRGAWAGPLVAAAVILPRQSEIPDGINDSKKLSDNKRRRLNELIREIAIGIAIAEISVETINRIGIGSSTQRALRAAIRKLKPQPDFHLIDAFHLRYIPKREQLAIVKGDSLSVSIAAASIVAKVYRDDLMERLHYQYREYYLASHKGYGTQKHQEAILKHGLCPIHRIHFVPKEFIIKRLFTESFDCNENFCQKVSS